MIRINIHQFEATHKFVLMSLLIVVLGCTDNSSADSLLEVEANFDANKISIDEEESVTFTDQSVGNPTTWEWHFEGGDPSISTIQNPKVQYSEPGRYDVTLRVTNSNSEDSKTVDEFIEVNCECSIECTDNCTSKLLAKIKMSVDGTFRTYDVFLPSSHNLSSGLPVIIDLHGFTSNASEQRSISDFTDLAEENDIIMVWPEALASGTNCHLLGGVSGKYWNANLGAVAEDINFIDRLIDELDLDYNIDLKRVYVTGFSNGGFMVYSIACALSARIAAVTSVAGSMTKTLLNSVCNPKRQIPVMHVHGTKDMVAFWDGQESCQGGKAAVNDVVSFWRTNAGCSDTYNETLYKDIDASDGSTARMITFDNCGNKVNFLIVEGGGHNWPGSPYLIDQGLAFFRPINNDITTSELIWEFFKQHQLP